MPRYFELTGPGADKEGDVEIDNLNGFSVVEKKKKKDGRILITVKDPASPQEVEEADDAAFYLHRLGFSEVKEA